MLPVQHAAMQSTLSSEVLIFVLVLASFLYLRGLRQIHRTSEQVIPPWRAGSFFLGLFSIWLALGSPLAALDHELLTIHMMQHLLLMTFAPALILLGAPVRLLLQGLPTFTQGLLSRLFRRPLIQRAGRVLSQPALCWTAYAAALVGWHIPMVFAMGSQSTLWHAVQHASFFGAGLLFWWPVIQPWPSLSVGPRWSMLLYLFLATLPCDILSGFLVFSERVVYPVFLTAPRRFGMTVLEDQQCAAALMWTCVTIVYLVPATILTIRLLGARNCPANETTQPDLPRVAVLPKHPQKVQPV